MSDQAEVRSEVSVAGPRPSKSDATGWLRRVVAVHLDELLAASGFTRRRNSVNYSRPIDHGRQVISLFVWVRPRYAPDSFRLTMHTGTHLPGVLRLAGIMHAGDTMRSLDGSLAYNESFDTIRDRRPVPLWLFTDEQTLDGGWHRLRMLWCTWWCRTWTRGTACSG